MHVYGVKHEIGQRVSGRNDHTISCCVTAAAAGERKTAVVVAGVAGSRHVWYYLYVCMYEHPTPATVPFDYTRTLQARPRLLPLSVVIVACHHVPISLLKGSVYLSVLIHTHAAVDPAVTS